MPTGKRIMQNYEELADLMEQRGDARMRDRLLILAAWESSKVSRILGPSPPEQSDRGAAEDLGLVGV